MKSSQFLKLLLAVSIAGLLMLCATGAAVFWFVVQPFAEESVSSGGPLRDTIAMVGNDGNIWLAAPDGGETRKATTDGRGYQFPTWSPDGRRIAFVGLGDEGHTILLSYDTVRHEKQVLFDRSDATPFYIYWSPDSRSVTFLTQEASAMSMRLANVEQPDSDRVMAQGAPFYWVWSPAGNQVFMHVGGARAFSGEAHLSLLSKNEGAHRIELKTAPGGFQAPLWSASGRYIFYIGADENDQEAIYRTDMQSSVQTLITPLSGAALLVLSPDDQHIAYVEMKQVGQVPAVGTAAIVDTEGEAVRKILENWVAAMYWSPDGKKLALLTLAQGSNDPIARVPGQARPALQPAGMRWWVYDLQTGELEVLTSFAPTHEFLQTVPFFDQYHLSLTFWSPDSRYLVITMRIPEERGGTVWVLDTTGQEEPRQIGLGSFAVWSWH